MLLLLHFNHSPNSWHSCRSPACRRQRLCLLFPAGISCVDRPSRKSVRRRHKIPAGHRQDRHRFPAGACRSPDHPCLVLRGFIRFPRLGLCGIDAALQAASIPHGDRHTSGYPEAPANHRSLRVCRSPAGAGTEQAQSRQEQEISCSVPALCLSTFCRHGQACRRHKKCGQGVRHSCRSPARPTGGQ